MKKFAVSLTYQQRRNDTTNTLESLTELEALRKTVFELKDKGF